MWLHIFVYHVASRAEIRVGLQVGCIDGDQPGLYCMLDLSFQVYMEIKLHGVEMVLHAPEVVCQGSGDNVCRGICTAASVARFAADHLRYVLLDAKESIYGWNE